MVETASSLHINIYIYICKHIYITGYTPIPCHGNRGSGARRLGLPHEPPRAAPAERHELRHRAGARSCDGDEVWGTYIHNIIYV